MVATISQPLEAGQAGQGFLTKVFNGKRPDEFILIWTKKGIETKSFWFRDSTQAEKTARLFQDGNVYFGVGASPADLGPYNRCEADNISSIFGVWIDIDVAGPGHKKSNLPITLAEARDLLAEVPLQPTFVIQSGHGLQAYWLFTEPVVISNNTERTAIAELTKKWNSHFESLAQAHGWTMDSTFDLARLMRLPGTFNCKIPGQPRPVTILESNPVRYQVAEIQGYLEQFTPAQVIKQLNTAPATEDKTESFVLDPDATYNPELFEALSEADPKFLATWKHERPELLDKSLSGYDMALIGLTLRAGWPDQAIVNLVIHHRRKWGDKSPKLMRQDYFKQSLAKAREWLKDPKPDLYAGATDLDEITEETLAALVKANNPPTIFQHLNVLCRLLRDDRGELITDELTTKSLRIMVAKVTSWFTQTSKGAKKEAYPPLPVIESVRETANGRFPVLKALTKVPVFTKSGRLIITPGFDEVSGIFYEPAIDIPTIPQKPSAEDVERAVSIIIDDLLHDFPFEGESGRANPNQANAIAELLQPFCRDMLGRHTPLFLHEAPQVGTGKTLLTEVLLYPALGSIPFGNQPRDDEEMGKRLLTMLRSGASAFVLDNCQYKLDSATLAQVLTTGYFSGRILGSSTELKAQVTATFVATANNPVFSDELRRRTVPIRLNSQLVSPWRRTEADFKHPNLRLWLENNRASVCWAALTLIQNWISQGQKPGPAVLGSFEQWGSTMNGILAAAGIGGFLANLKTFYEAVSVEDDALKSFCSAWYEAVGDGDVKTSEVLAYALQAEGLDLGDGNQRSQLTKLGGYLKKNLDKRLEIEAKGQRIEIQLKKAGAVNGNVRYKLHLVRIVEPLEV